MDEFFEDFEALKEAEDAETACESLARFLQACEEALLAIEPPASGVAIPEGVEGDLEVECRAIAKLVADARAGSFATVLASPLLEKWAAVLVHSQVDAALQAGGLAQLLSELQAASATFVADAPEGASAATRRLGLLLVAAAALQLYAHANWTGPDAKDFGGPFDVEKDTDLTSHGRLFLEGLEVDGEEPYELLKGAGYLWLACALLGVLPPCRDSEGKVVESKQHSVMASGRTLDIWRGRCAFVWQLSLAEASERGQGQSPWLFKLSVDDLVGGQDRDGLFACTGFLSATQVAAARSITAPVLNTWRDSSGRLKASPSAPTSMQSDDSAPSAEVHALGHTTLCSSCPDVRAALITEFCLRLCWYGRAQGFDDFIKDACAPIEFDFEITGELGIKRKYQTEQTAQMVVKASSTVTAANPQSCESQDVEEERKAPKAFSLREIDDMTDVLDRPKFAENIDEKEREKLDKPLTAPQQAILLAKCQHLWTTSNPNDELLLTLVHALAERVLVTFEKPEDTEEGQMSTANWLTFSCGLFFRCRAEHHRNKTRERSAFQLQALVDQFNDEKPSVAHRLLLVHAAGYPARFHLQREMAMRMMRMGMVSTAFEQFKTLRMWPDAIDCLMVADRKAECLDMVNDLLQNRPTPRLWCALGDIETDRAIECYEKAWELSKHRYARAQRSLGRVLFFKGNLEKAVECFQVAVQINPLHSSIWFTCGVAQMRLKRWDDAALSLTRCCGVDDENAEAWANLGAVHNERNDLKQARSCFYEATRRARENWRMWESFKGICMRLRDIQGVITCLKQLVELNQAKLIDERTLGILTMSVLSDADGLYKDTTGKQFATALLDFFKFLTSKCTSEPCYWRFLGEIRLARGEAGEALECRLRQSRASQARLWGEADPEAFGKELADLIRCFESVLESLTDPSLVEKAGAQLQPFAYTVRNADRQLQAKLDTCTQVPQAWLDAHAKITKLAAEAEEIARRNAVVSAAEAA